MRSPFFNDSGYGFETDIEKANGAFTPEAIMNAIAQSSAKTNTNAYEDFLKHARLPESVGTETVPADSGQGLPYGGKFGAQGPSDVIAEKFDPVKAAAEAAAKAAAEEAARRAAAGGDATGRGRATGRTEPPPADTSQGVQPQNRRPQDVSDLNEFAAWAQSQGLKGFDATAAANFKNSGFAGDAHSYWQIVQTAGPYYYGGGSPKPQGTENADVMATWMRTFTNYEDITPADITNHRRLGIPLGVYWARVKAGQIDRATGNPITAGGNTGGNTGGTTGGTTGGNTGGTTGGGTTGGTTGGSTTTTNPTPAVPPATGGDTGPVKASQEYLDALDRALRMSEDRRRNQALRDFRSAGSVGGLENTGAWLSGQQELVGDLATEAAVRREQAMLATSEAERQRAFQADQSALDRKLQQYGIDVQSYTSKFNTQTQAGVQQAAAQMQYDLGLRGIEMDKKQLEEVIRNNTLNYNVEVGRQDLGRYQTDTGAQMDLFRIMADIGPEAFLRMLFGEQDVPGFQPYVK